MHHAAAVGVGETGGNLCGDLGGFCWVQARALAQHGRERATLDVLHHDEVGTVVLAPVEDLDDVRVREVGRCLGFTPEPLHEGQVHRQFREQHLERNGSIEQAIVSQVDLRHAAARNQVRQFIAVGEGPGADDRFHGASA